MGLADGKFKTSVTDGFPVGKEVTAVGAALGVEVGSVGATVGSSLGPE